MGRRRVRGTSYWAMGSTANGDWLSDSRITTRGLLLGLERPSMVVCSSEYSRERDECTSDGWKPQHEIFQVHFAFLLPFISRSFSITRKAAHRSTITLKDSPRGVKEYTCTISAASSFAHTYPARRFAVGSSPATMPPAPHRTVFGERHDVF